MAGMSNYLEAALINAVLRATNYTAPVTVYVSLHTADPGGTGANEITAGAYVRQSTSFGAPVTGVSLNSGVIDFPVSSSIHGTITHFAIWDAATAGNSLVYGQLTTARTYNVGEFLRITISSLSVTLA